MDINSKSIALDIGKKIEDFHIDFGMQSIGTVIRSGDGVVLVSGLLDCKYGELLKFEGDTYGIAMSLEDEEIGAVLFNNVHAIAEGSNAVSTGHVVEVPVGEELLGRVLNPLGKPLDGRGSIHPAEYRAIEKEAPSIMERSSVNEPLQTGILAIDSMIPIGKGQRELIIGDRQTGKTAIALDAILNQKGKNTICIYVAIGQKAATVSKIISTLRDMDAMNYCIVVNSTASDSSPLQYIAPYAGCAIGEYFMDKGRDVLIVYDDLSKHAVAYRTMSLLLRRPPGREAYPGDVFYLHSRLLERAAKLSSEIGGGSMTALPIIETQAGDISGYIPTNVISITDGQLFLESELFFAGVRPAINVGLSVSRVGGAAQIPAMKKVSGKLRLDLAQYRELEVFSQFSSDLDPSTQKLLEHGQRVTEMLKQGQHQLIDVVHQVILLYAVNHEWLRDISIEDIHTFRQGLIDYINTNHRSLIDDIRGTKDLSHENTDEIEAAMKEFKKVFKREV